MKNISIIEIVKMTTVGSAAIAAGFVSFPIAAAGLATLGVFGSSMLVKTAGIGAGAGATATATATATTAATAVLTEVGTSVAIATSVLTGIGAGKTTAVAVDGLHNVCKSVKNGYNNYCESELVKTRKTNKLLKERLDSLSKEVEQIKMAFA